MNKTVITFLLLISFFIIINCNKDTNPIMNMDTPEWLNSYIEDIQDIPDYVGTKVYRYEWKEKFVYHVMIPISSCAYCEVYNQSGLKIEFNDDNTFQDFLSNRKNEVIVWEWKDDN